MKLSLRLLLLLPFIFVMVGCPADDEPVTVEVRPYSEVYAEDIAEIEDFMNTHFVTVDGDYNVTFTKITSSTPGTPITVHPDLTFKTVSKGGVDHKLYFLKLREGVGSNPTRLDSVFTSYYGKAINKNTSTNELTLNDFDEASSPVWLELPKLIQGWQDVFPEFKSGNSVYDSSTGLTTFSDFGAGVMFVPSGLGYFNVGGPSIGSYTPIIFSFKLMKIRESDDDGDKVLSKYEYGGPLSGTAIDSDGDGKFDYTDFDDDNDGKLTIEEVRITPGTSSWHTYDNIPTCVGGGNGKKKHLDPFCQ